MGTFLGVAAGSAEAPKFIHLTYAAPGRGKRRVALIGKGVTFDSGGLDLKNSEGMQRMRNDMAGAPAVLGLMRPLPRLRLPVEARGPTAATETRPCGPAARPGSGRRPLTGWSTEGGPRDPA